MREKQRRAECKAQGIDPDLPVEEEAADNESDNSEEEEKKVEEIPWTEPAASKNVFVDMISGD